MADTTNALALSDEDFMALNDAPVSQEPSASTETETSAAETVTTPEASTEVAIDGLNAVGSAEKEETATTPAVVENDDSAFDYKAAYKKLRQPFKADGKLVEIRDDEEIVRLMQMGVNYSRKMQELNATAKTAAMLKQHGISEEQLSFLIDVNNKDPEALKKLLKDSAIDPLDIDIAGESAYVANKNIVSDAQLNFTSVMDSVAATEEGKQTLTMLHSTWDSESKNALWDNPSIMASIHEQRQSGVYKTISDEVERQKLTGAIPAGTPFLQAYHAVGNFLMQQRANTNATGNAVDKRVVAPKSAANSDRAAKAASPNLGAKTAVPFKNPLAMSDEEFMKTL